VRAREIARLLPDPLLPSPPRAFLTLAGNTVRELIVRIEPTGSADGGFCDNGLHEESEGHLIKGMTRVVARHGKRREESVEFCLCWSSQECRQCRCLMTDAILPASGRESPDRRGRNLDNSWRGKVNVSRRIPLVRSER